MRLSCSCAGVSRSCAGVSRSCAEGCAALHPRLHSAALYRAKPKPRCARAAVVLLFALPSRVQHQVSRRGARAGHATARVGIPRWHRRGPWRHPARHRRDRRSRSHARFAASRRARVRRATRSESRVVGVVPPNVSRGRRVVVAGRLRRVHREPLATGARERLHSQPTRAPQAPRIERRISRAAGSARLHVHRREPSVAL
jgi:hypothetical protein